MAAMRISHGVPHPRPFAELGISLLRAGGRLWTHHQPDYAACL